MEHPSPYQPQRLLPRTLAPAVARALRVFSVVVIVGPRQVGKSTLVREGGLAEGRTYLTLDDLDLLAEARSHPADLLGRSPRITLDEVQRAPELLLAIKQEVDRRRTKGRFLVTGSADVRAMAQVADHLPGRAAYLELDPLSVAELRAGQDGSGFEALFTAKNGEAARKAMSQRSVRRPDFDDLILGGGLPEPALMQDPQDRDLWFTSYMRTWLERGLRDITRVPDLHDMTRLLRAAAARTGQLLNQAEVARDAALARTTAHRYLSHAEVGMLWSPLSTWARNPSVRVVKTSKLFWRDTGMAAHLLRIRSKEQLRDHTHRGALLENLVLQNLRVWSGSRRQPAELCYWRTAGGREVDFVVELESRVVPVEIKSGTRVRREERRHLRSFLEEHGRLAPYGVVLHGGRTTELLEPRILGVPLGTVL